ncbi:18556_t:CDS:1, partial [Racocetra persica]
DIKNKNEQLVTQIEFKSKLSRPLLFGLQYKNVEAVRKTLSSNILIKIKPFNSYSKSIQRSHITGLEKRLLEVVEKEKENFFNLDDNIVFKQTKFEINSYTYNINYRKIDNQLIELQTQAIVKLIDHDRISRDTYRSLSKIDQSLIWANAVYNMRQEIIKQVNMKISISLVDIN